MLDIIKLFIIPLNDIFKYFIYREVSTGDKTLDNLLVCLIITGLTYITSEKFLKNLFDKNNHEYGINYYTENIYKFKQVRWGDNSLFLSKEIKNLVLTYFLKNIPPYISKKMNWGCNLGFEDKKIMKITSEDFVERNIDILERRNIYTNKTIDGIVFRIPIHIYTSRKNSYIYIDDEFIHYENDKDLEEFLDIINKQEDVKEISKDTLRIYRYKDEKIVESSVTIYPDRNFDNWISIHKPLVQRYITRFIKANETKKSDFGGFGSYNLGVIIHGEPGTGKTMFIKSLANALNRDILIVDMKKIKTNTEFERIIKENYEKRILSFDEFDSIKGVVSRDKNKVEEDKITIISKLEKQKHQLMNAETSDKNDYIKKEIERIDKCIEEERDKLDIYSMLTILDGIEEFRGRVIVALTNHIEHIDPALIREGRFDFKFKLTKFKDEEIKELLTKMFSSSDTEDTSYRKKIIQSHTFKSDVYTPVQIMNIAMSNEFEKTIEILSEK